jgi:hypothetical protein
MGVGQARCHGSDSRVLWPHPLRQHRGDMTSLHTRPIPGRPARRHVEPWQRVLAVLQEGALKAGFHGSVDAPTHPCGHAAASVWCALPLSGPSAEGTGMECAASRQAMRQRLHTWQELTTLPTAAQGIRPRQSAVFLPIDQIDQQQADNAVSSSCATPHRCIAALLPLLLIRGNTAVWRRRDGAYRGTAPLVPARLAIYSYDASQRWLARFDASASRVRRIR